MSSDAKMLIKLLSGERGNQPQQDPAVPLLMQFFGQFNCHYEGTHRLHYQGTLPSVL